MVAMSAVTDMTADTALRPLVDFVWPFASSEVAVHVRVTWFHTVL
jgi:hypothetical protein